MNKTSQIKSNKLLVIAIISAFFITLPSAVFAECVDTDGDGWGVRGKKKCRVTGKQRKKNRISSSSSTYTRQTTTTLRATTTTLAPRVIAPVTSECIDADGDGWGWDGKQSCKMEEPDITPARTVTEPKAPVTTTTQAPAQKTASSTHNLYSFFKERCDNWALIPYEEYMIQNNVWNDQGMHNKNYSLCVELTGDDANPVPRWRYDFLNERDGEIYEVKAYPQVYYGEKRQATPSGSASALGLPAKVPYLDNFEVTYKYSENGVGERNVALESFFHTTCDIRPDNQEFEMMIWVGKPTKRTGGTNKIGEAYIDGAMWDVWLNKNLSWDYVAYVRQNPSTSGTIDWNAFVDWTLNEGPRMGVPRLNPNSCMNTIELGTEIFWGKGEFILEEFDVRKW